MGTNHWLAPEMVKMLMSPNATKYSYEVDIWSFGIFALELANSEPPFFDIQSPNILYPKVANATAQDYKLKEKWSAEYQAFVWTCLNKDPEKRPTA